MKKLDDSEVRTFSGVLGFTEAEAEEITEIFYHEKERGNYALFGEELETVGGYITAWENNWYRFGDWASLVEDEALQNEGMTEAECLAELNHSIFQLSTGLVIQAVF